MSNFIHGFTSVFVSAFSDTALYIYGVLLAVFIIVLLALIALATMLASIDVANPYSPPIGGYDDVPILGEDPSRVYSKQEKGFDTSLFLETGGR